MTALQRLGPLGGERPVIEVEGSYFDLSPLTADVD
jgi:2,4-diketo-3-deoxy-L-fuconate hydrolase